MSEAFSILLDSLGKAFGTMAAFEVLPGVSLLSFFISLIILHTIISIVWISNKNNNKKE